MCLRTMPYYWNFKISAWEQINAITTDVSMEYLDTDIFENQYQLLRKYLFGKKVPYNTGHRSDEMYIRKNNIVAFFTTKESNFGRRWDPQNGNGEHFSYNVSGIINFPNSILLTDIL